MKSRLFFLALLIPSAFGTAGCGGSPSEKHISRADYGRDWPLTVEEGTLGCWGPMAVTFTTKDGTTYALNGTALGWADDNGWSRDKQGTIWDPNQGDIGALIEDGLALCKS